MHFLRLSKKENGPKKRGKLASVKSELLDLLTWFSGKNCQPSRSISIVCMGNCTPYEQMAVVASSYTNREKRWHGCRVWRPRNVYSSQIFQALGIDEEAHVILPPYMDDISCSMMVICILLTILIILILFVYPFSTMCAIDKRVKEKSWAER